MVFILLYLAGQISTQNVTWKVAFLDKFAPNFSLILSKSASFQFFTKKKAFNPKKLLWEDILFRIFQGFRICINFYPISKNELARLNLLSEHLGARFRVFCQISRVEQWTFWGVCQFLARNQCPRPFYHKESTKLHRHSYQKPLLLLTYLIPYVNASSWNTQLI